MGTIVGIDLGTTNSCVAIIKDGRPKVLEDDRGYTILPSCIATRGEGRFVVGHAAKALVLNHPKNTLYAVKRLIGRKFESDEVQAAIRRVAYDVEAADDGSVVLRMGDYEITPSEAASIILTAAKEIAEKATGEPTADVVITVPANFNHSQRRDTMEAAEAAGLNVVRLLNEPTAAALAYGFKKDVQKKIAVFDLGGGTFDVSVIEAGEDVYETLATGGNTFLGGDDFDYRIIDWLAEQFMADGGADPREDANALQRLKDAAERAKCELSFVDKTPVLIPRLLGSQNLELELTRVQLEELVQDLINETVKITDETMKDAKLTIEDIDEIVLVGGMTRMPKVQETIKVFFGMNPCKGVHPEEVVAIGAAVHGYSLESEEGSTLLLDVTPFSLGMDVAGGYFKAIISRNTTVPCAETRTFTNVQAGQTEVRVIVRMGESRVAENNEFLGEFVLTGLAAGEAMTAKVEVSFRIDGNGILHVSAIDQATGESQAIQIREYITEDAVENIQAVQLAESGVDVEAEQAVQLARDGSGGGGEGGLRGRLARLAGFGKKGKAAVADDQALEEVADPLALKERSEEEAAAALEAETAAGVEEEAAETAADPHALAERDEVAAQAARQHAAAEVAAPEGPDAYGIVSRGEDSPFGSDLGDALDADGLDSLDPFGIAPKEEDLAASGIEHSKKVEDAPVEEAPPPAPTPKAQEGAAGEATPKAAPAGKKRKTARLRISYKKSSTFVKEYTRNLKRGGTFIKTGKPLSVGRSCILHLTIPDWDSPVELRGSVVWSSKDATLEDGQEQGMGIKYDPEDSAGRQALEAVLSHFNAAS
ncbi:MAG: molecular chaperone DnaK [Deltaproteobacteria bacterium]|nr:molecular chaperone DnaK [Deltaproteobacteria bacterium]